MAKRLSPNIFAHLLVVAGNDLGNRKNISVRNKMQSTKNLLFMKMDSVVKHLTLYVQHSNKREHGVKDTCGT